MKLKNLFLILLAAVSLFSCKKSYVAPNEFSDVSWQIGAELQNKNPIYLNINKYLTFSDVSQGALSHEWIVSEDGVKFLTADIMTSSEKDYEQYIDETIPYTNNETTIHLYLTKAGQHTVRLRNTFAENVQYMYRPDPTNDKVTIDTINCEYIGGVYVFDTTFIVDVYDPKMVPGAKVYRDRACTEEVEIGDYESETFATVEVPYGDSLFFVDNSYDRPNSYNWKCEDAGYASIKDSVAAMGFTTMNTEKTPYKVMQTVSRVEVLHDDYFPTANAVTATVPLNIVVVKRADAISFSEMTQISNREVKLVAEQAAFDAKGIAEGNASAFSLKVGSRMVQGTEVVVDSLDNTILYVTFDGNILNDVELALSVDGATSAMSLDGRRIELNDASVAVSSSVVVESAKQVLGNTVAVTVIDDEFCATGAENQFAELFTLTLDSKSYKGTSITPDADRANVLNITFDCTISGNEEIRTLDYASTKGEGVVTKGGSALNLDGGMTVELLEPLKVETITLKSSNVISLTLFDGKYNPATITADQLEAFSLSIYNNFSSQIYDTIVKPTIVEIDKNESYVLNLTFEGEMYNTDVLKLNYTAPASGTIAAEDGRPFTMATDSEVPVDLVEILPSEAFDFDKIAEQGIDINTLWSADALNIRDGLQISVVDDPYDPTDKKCLKVVCDPKVTARILVCDIPIKAEAGTYVFKFSMNVESCNNGGAAGIAWRMSDFKTTTNADFFGTANMTSMYIKSSVWSPESGRLGLWKNYPVFKEGLYPTLTSPNGGENGRFLIDFTNTFDGVVYLRDFSISNGVQRPIKK